MLRVWGKMAGVGSKHTSERSRLWAATMEGYEGASDDLTVAHQNSSARVGTVTGPSTLTAITREERENLLDATMAPGATRAVGAGHREKEEEPDPYRTSFERDRDRILHSSAFRRLAGKTQVFVFPNDHQRTRLTHALEVAQVASSIARSVGLNVALAEAIALGHDCGHGPGGHASEDALEPFVPGGFNHASWGADVSLRSLNLCEETLDGIRNHSWSRPAPSTPEGEVVSWADRIAYVCHDFEDAVSADVVRPDDLPDLVRSRCGTRRGQQLGTFIDAVVTTILSSGQVGMNASHAQALAVFRAFNYETIYLRDASQANARKVEGMLRALVEHFVTHPEDLPPSVNQDVDPVHNAVAYVAGMTDRFACRSAVLLLNWPIDELPNGIDR